MLLELAVEAAVPPLKYKGEPPSVAWNSGPYAGAVPGVVHEVMYVVTSNFVCFRMFAKAPGNVLVPVLSWRFGVSTFCCTDILTAGIRFDAVMLGTFPYEFSSWQYQRLLFEDM
jgi:hypothetical protein